ncbi:hypothetical protein DPMN_113374 [Dreissena polymorpha]|uniref:Uncharacterized protein n=1 Tax=Dreissena polymorpha TaxID=45954 RepID=A0A9D4KI68_DREPO|nr:hypothetical protein DPMN_113374 [Dreissena polymorpha]
MEKQFKQLETDLKSIKKSIDDKDRFSDVMNISFVLINHFPLRGKVKMAMCKQHKTRTACE